MSKTNKFKVKPVNMTQYDEVFRTIRKKVDDSKCATALEDMIKKTNDKELINVFLHEAGTLLTEFGTYFKGIGDIDKHFYIPIFEYWMLYKEPSFFTQTKDIVRRRIVYLYDKDNSKYISIESHLDCLNRSLFNQLRRTLHIFDENYKLRK